MHAKPGDTVRAGDPLLTLYADDPARFPRALDALDGGYEIGGPVDSLPLILTRIQA